MCSSAHRSLANHIQPVTQNNLERHLTFSKHLQYLHSDHDVHDHHENLQVLFSVQRPIPDLRAVDYSVVQRLVFESVSVLVCRAYELFRVVAIGFPLDDSGCDGKSLDVWAAQAQAPRFDPDSESSAEDYLTHVS
jgi:hypothetical protein